MTIDPTSQFWIDEFRIDLAGLRIFAANGPLSVEPKVMQVLEILAEHPGETVLRETFMQRVWDVDYGSDESLTRAISILRKAFGDSRGRRTMIETVPRKGYRLIADIRSGPANSEKDTPQKAGLEKADAQGRNPEMPQVGMRESVPEDYSPVRARRSYLVFALAAALIIIPGMIWLFSGKAGSLIGEQTVRHSVQLQGFEPGSQIEADTRLARDLTSSIASSLSASSIVLMAGATDMEDTAEIVVRGEAWVEDGQPHAQLTFDHARSDYQIWTTVLDPEQIAAPDFAFGVSLHVVRLLNCMASWRGDDYENSPEALALYVRFCDAVEHQRLRDYSPFTQDIYEAEPDNPTALALHAYMLHSRLTRYRDTPDAERKPLVDMYEALISEAQSLSPDSPLVKGLAAIVTSDADDWIGTAEALGPLASRNGLPRTIYTQYGEHLRKTGRIRDALQVYTQYLERDPTHPALFSRIGWLHTLVNEHDAAELAFARAERIDPDHPGLSQRRGQAVLHYGSPEEVRRLFQSYFGSAEIDPSKLRNCDQLASWMIAFDRVDLSQFKAICGSYPDRFYPVRQLSFLGDVDGAYQAAEGYDWSSHHGATIILFYREMEAFRADPRFWPLVEDLGLVDYWKTIDRWPDFCLYEDHEGYCPAR